MTSDPGIRPPNNWSLDAALVQATHDAVLSLRAKNEWGPRNRDRLVFRASELGDVAAFRDHRGDPGGCARKTFYSFWAERFKPRDLTAEELMNFAKGVEEQGVMKRYLVEAGLFVEEEVRLGAWAPCRNTDGNGLPLYCEDPASPTCGVGPFIHGDHRFPDRSGGLVRGKADFIIDHPQHGKIPLEWKSASSYIFGAIGQHGPKGDNALQAHYYGYEMGTSHVAIGYVDKESGRVAIFTAPTDTALIDEVLGRAAVLRNAIQAGDIPPAPKGVRAPRDYYDRAWPCYYYAPKKKRIGACPFYEHCHGALPVEGTGTPPRTGRPAFRRRTKTGDGGLDFNG